MSKPKILIDDIKPSSRQNVSLPTVGNVVIGNGTVPVSNKDKPMSSDEMIKSLGKASKRSLFPVKEDGIE